jgi:hypothetical protein
MTSKFKSFHTAYPPDAKRVAYKPARHDAFAAKVPDALAEEWREFGFGSYAHGLLWMVEPDAPFLDADDWTGVDDSHIEVLRSAFADVLIWQGGEFRWLSVLSGKIHTYVDDPEVVFHVLANKDFRKTTLLERLFGIARKKHGDLGANECYGFAPLPSLGGAIAEQHLMKTEMRPYLAMAAQAL